MNFETISVPGYNTKNKKLLMIDGQPVALANGESRISLFIQYIQGYDVEENIWDKRVLKKLTPYRERYAKLYSQMSD